MSKQTAATSSQNDPSKKAFKVYNFIVSKGGEVDFQELIQHPSPLKGFSPQEAAQWLLEFTELNDKEDTIEKPCFVVRKISEDRATVRVCVKARLCLNYEKNGFCKHDSECLQFHICKGFLEGRCTDPSICSRSHDFLDRENLNKIQKYRLDFLSNSSLRKVITRNIPFVCENYVNSNCVNPYCLYLHVCPRLVKKICEDKEEDCPLRLSHDLHSPHNKRVIKEFAVPVKYLLCNVLVSKDTKVEVKEKDTKRKGKVNKLNNLNSNDDDEKQVGEFSKLELPQNITPNVVESPSSKASKNKSTRKKDAVHTNEPERLNIRQGLLPTPSLNLHQRRPDTRRYLSLPGGTGRGFGKPVPLMGLPMDSSEYVRAHAKEVFRNQLFPQDLESRDQSVRGGLGQRGGGSNQLLRGGRKWRSMDHFHSTLLSGQPSMAEQMEQKNRFDIEGAQGIGGRGRGARGRGSWRGRGRGKVLSEREPVPESEPLDVAFSKEDEEFTEPKVEARKGKRRPRNRRRNPRSNSTDGDSTKDIEEGEEQVEDVEEIKKNLMQFQLEDEEEKDLIDWNDVDDTNESSDLVDLNFETDVGLSQASETSQMWDIFSQDQLYNDDSLQDRALGSNSDPTDSCESNESSNTLVASERAVFNCILKEFGGVVSLSEISSRVDLFHPDFQDHEKWFKDHSSSFLMIYRTDGQVLQIKTIALRAKMCFKYSWKNCNSKSCPFFHVCKEYIAKGRCDEGVKCKKNHGFSDNHNKHIASKLFPKEHFDDEQLLCLIQASTPQVCMDYNNGKCRMGKRCTKIHICKNYGKKRCPKGSCKLMHNNGLLTPATKSILSRFKIKMPTQESGNGFMLAKTLLVCDDLPGNVKRPSVDRDQKQSKSEATNPYHISSNLGSHICLKFLLGRCKKGSKCTDHHCPMPYQWVYLTDHKWHMLIQKENQNLEMFFCNENQTDAMIFLTLNCSSSSSDAQDPQQELYFYKVDFNEMHIKTLEDEGPGFPVKRLSTESDVHIPDCPLATSWRWFWKESEVKFTEYQQSKTPKDPTSATIEKHFQEGHSTFNFHREPYDYRLYFRKKPMVQKNLDPKYKTEREVCRRPRNISQQDFEKFRSKTYKLPNEDNREMLHLWKKMAECQEFLLYPLKSHSKEFKEMEAKFLASIGDKEVTINSIDRVQNPFMMEKYLRKKNQMQKLANASNGHNVDERFLFHGTSHRNIRPICKQNFDWRLYGEVTGNVYGEGAYFARDSSISDCYCPEDEDGLRYIFVAKVLVGSYSKGEKKYKRPPQKDANDPHSDFYDSCVDKVHDPKIFVVFDVDQYYPAYLVEYRRQDTEQLRRYGTTVTSVPKRPAPIPPVSSSYTHTGSRMGLTSYNPSAPSASTSSYVSAGASTIPMSTPIVPPVIEPAGIASAMEKQWEDFSYSSSSKKSSQQNCLVM